MEILVTGGTGTVGSQVVQELLKRNAAVQVLTRNKSKASGLPTGVTAVEGNLQEVATVRRVFNRIDKVLLLNFSSPTEPFAALMAVTATEAAAIALTTSGHEGQVYDLAGPHEVTGTTTAATWSRSLGRPVKYAGDDLDAWERQFLQFLPEYLVYDYKNMYAYFQKEGLKASPEAHARLTKLPGHPARDFETFAAETAATWK
jgi:uncharacterized protein YbjT (DUF2867 family)